MASLEASEDAPNPSASIAIEMKMIDSSEPQNAFLLRLEQLSGALDRGDPFAVNLVKLMTANPECQIRDAELRFIFHAAQSGDAFIFWSLSPEQLSRALSLRNKEGCSLLNAAADFGHIDLVRFFAEADPSGSLVNDQDKQGWSPLITACSLGYLEIAEELIGRGANVNLKNHRGHTPLHYAASKGSLKLAQVLISHGAEVKAKDNVGCTPLHKAASRGRIELCKLLITKGAEINAVDQAEQTPLTHAVICDHKEAVLLLIKHGADMDDKVEYAVLHRYPDDYLADARDPCEPKTRKSIAWHKLPYPYSVRLSGSGVPVNSICLPYSAYSSRNRVYHDTRPLTDIVTLESANRALSYYNEKRLSWKGREYELVEALGGTVLAKASVFHCNFIARPKHGSEAQNRLFFAELKGIGLACAVCSIIGRPGAKTGLRGCKICKEYGGLIQHPRRKNGFTKWLT